MKKLTLTSHFSKRLDRLTSKADRLYYLGANLSTFEGKKLVAIVGTRKPTPYGKTITEEVSEKLARAGVVIVSGNAMGVDVIAQKAALQAGGQVISVVPSGLDKIYPATNQAVARAIVEKGGTVISEFEPGHSPTRYDFLRRNRIIAALSDLVIIPEAAERSGSLNTAKHAKDMKIPIGAFPGQVTNTMSSGTNKLLKEGACVIRGVDDALELLGLSGAAEQTSFSLEGDNEAQTAVLRAIHKGINDSHEIQANSGLTTTEFQTAITMLEVNGRIAISASGVLRLL